MQLTRTPVSLKNSLINQKYISGNDLSWSRWFISNNICRCLIEDLTGLIRIMFCMGRICNIYLDSLLTFSWEAELCCVFLRTFDVPRVLDLELRFKSLPICFRGLVDLNRFHRLFQNSRSNLLHCEKIYSCFGVVPISFAYETALHRLAVP